MQANKSARKPGGEVYKKQVAILDAGAQYGKVIDRRVRNLMVYSDLMPIDTPYEQLKDYAALIISGGPESVYDPKSPQPDQKIYECGKPLLGICYGMGLINQTFGGTVKKKSIREDGQVDIRIDTSSSLFNGLGNIQAVLMSHGDSMEKLAPGFKKIATSGKIIAAMEDAKRKMYGVQFHPEVDLSENGRQMIANFLFSVANLKPTYTLEDRLKGAIRYIKETVGNRKVLAFASGGVDSTVCSVLLGKALPADQVHIVHIDTGFMRKNESELVAKSLQTAGIKLEVIDAKKQFYSGTTLFKGKNTQPLNKVADPEVKRAIIGDTFMKVMDEVVNSLNLDPNSTVLAQGTLRPDLIESASSLASSKADVIKTHHNDTNLVRKLRDAGQVVEPLQDLHKDEVRQIGQDLGLAEALIWRQPFPGPGLVIRLLCSNKPYKSSKHELIAAKLKKFDDQEIATILLPVRTVGVQGDGRSYSYLVALSGTQNWETLLQKANEIPKKVHEVNRVIYIFGDKLLEPVNDITPTLPSTIATAQLREADWHVNEVLLKYDLQRTLSQVPVVSFPVSFGKPGYRSIGIRAFITNDFMTGKPAVPGKDLPHEALTEMVERVLTVPGISRVAYDLTSKPPGTTEWE